MKTKIMVLIVGIIVGIGISILYMVIFPKAVSVGDNIYLVKGKYFVFNDPENGMRILERTSNGISSKVFLPGRRHYEALTTGVDPSVMDIKSGDLIRTKNISYNNDSFDVDLMFYRYDGEKLINIPMVPMGNAK